MKLGWLRTMMNKASSIWKKNLEKEIQTHAKPADSKVQKEKIGDKKTHLNAKCDTNIQRNQKGWIAGGSAYGKQTINLYIII